MSSVQTLALDVQSMRAQARVGQARLTDKTEPGSDFGPSPGSKPGVEVWRIEKLRVAPVPHGSYGRFHTGDSYIVLHTKAKAGNSRALEWDLYFWLGAETSTDEAAVAAYKTVELDDRLGGQPVQHRETQHNESSEFLACFPSVRYLKGGVEGGLRSAAEAQGRHEPRLLRCKGRKTVLVTEQPLRCASLNRGDVFVLDLGDVIYQWNGRDANRREKARALEVSLSIRDDDRKGRANIVVVDDADGPPAEDEQGFWRALEGSPKDVKPARAAGEDDQGGGAGNARGRGKASGPDPGAGAPALFRISDNGRGRSVRLTPVQPPSGAKGLSKSLLQDDDAFLLDARNSVFVWIGRGASSAERREAMKHALKYIAAHKMPRSTQVTRVAQGGEPSAFKCHFVDWHAPTGVVGDIAGFQRGLARVAATSEGATDEALASAMAAADSAPRSARDAPLTKRPDPSELTVWRIVNFERDEVAKADNGIFNAGDCYVVLHAERDAGGRPGPRTVYFWLGRDSSQDERGAAALQAVAVSDALGGGVPQVRVVMGHEPARFLSLFRSAMIVFTVGGAASGFRDVSGSQGAAPGGEGAGSGSLFQVRGTEGDHDVHAVQVPARASSLNSGDCFLACTALAAAPAQQAARPSSALPSWMAKASGASGGGSSASTLFVWTGSSSSEAERGAVDALAEALRAATARGANPNGSAKDLRILAAPEGKEPAPFWAALGGKAAYASRGKRMAGNAAYATAAMAQMEPRLFNCSDRTGTFKAEELHNFAQDDLDGDDIMLLDAGSTIFLWVGAGASEGERRRALPLAEEYARTVGAAAGRPPEIPIVRVEAGKEPAHFRAHFHGWSEQKASPTYDPYQAKLQDQTGIRVSGRRR